MNSKTDPRNAVPPVRSSLARLSRADVLRQTGVLLAIAVVWSLLLTGFLALTRKGPTAAAADAKPTAQPVPSAAPSAPLFDNTTATEKPAVSPTTEVLGERLVGFRAQVLPILQSRCERCHGSGRTEAGLSLTSYPAVLAGSSKGAVVVAGDAASSRIVQLIVSGQMPRQGAKLPESEIQTVTDWISQGALDN